MGASSIPRRLPLILRRIRDTAAAVVAARPDALVIIDSPDFTHRVARKVRAAAPDDKDLCKRGEQAWAAAQGASAEIARKACATVESQQQVDGCLAAVGEVRRLNPADPEASRLAEAAAKQQAEHCASHSPVSVCA